MTRHRFAGHVYPVRDRVKDFRRTYLRNFSLTGGLIGGLAGFAMGAVWNGHVALSVTLLGASVLLLLMKGAWDTR